MLPALLAGSDLPHHNPPMLCFCLLAQGNHEDASSFGNVYDSSVEDAGQQGEGWVNRNLLVAKHAMHTTKRTPKIRSIMTELYILDVLLSSSNKYLSATKLVGKKAHGPPLLWFRGDCLSAAWIASITRSQKRAVSMLCGGCRRGSS